MKNIDRFGETVWPTSGRVTLCDPEWRIIVPKNNLANCQSIFRGAAESPVGLSHKTRMFSSVFPANPCDFVLVGTANDRARLGVVVLGSPHSGLETHGMPDTQGGAALALGWLRVAASRLKYAGPGRA